MTFTPASRDGSGTVNAAAVEDTALTLFAENGYHGTSMRDIAKALGIQAPSLYNHMESKYLLFRNIMMDTMTLLETDVFPALRSQGDPALRIRMAVEAHVTHHIRYPRRTHLGRVEQSSFNTADRAEFGRRQRAYTQQWHEVVEEGVAKGVFKLPAPRLAARAMIEMGISVASWYDPHGPLSAQEICHEYGRMALRMLGVLDAE